MPISAGTIHSQHVSVAAACRHAASAAAARPFLQSKEPIAQQSLACQHVAAPQAFPCVEFVWLRFIRKVPYVAVAGVVISSAVAADALVVFVAASALAGHRLLLKRGTILVSLGLL
jgi:hypothetical protein